MYLFNTMHYKLRLSKGSSTLASKSTICRRHFVASVVLATKVDDDKKSTELNACRRPKKLT